MKLESFSTILSDCTSKYNKIKKEDYLPEGQFAIIDQGQKFVGGYTDNGDLITYIEKEIIVFGDHTKILKFINFPIAIGADGVKVLHVNKEKADPKYIYYFLKSVKLPDAGYSRHFKFLKELKIPVPENIHDQVKIASLFNHVETLITQRKESIAFLDKLLESKFYEMFGDPVRNEKGWDTLNLKEIVKIGTGGTPSRKRDDFYGGTINWAKTTEVKGNYILDTEEKITELALKESNCKIYQNGTILLAMYGQGKTRGNVGFLKIPASTNQACAAIPPSENINQIFLFELLKNSYNYLRSLARGGNQENLNLDIVGKINIITPNPELQIQFATIVEKIEILKIEYNNSLNELENMFWVLIQNTFKYEIPINEINGKKKSDKIMDEKPNENFKIEKYLKEIEASRIKKDKIDITNMSFAEYLKFPEELQIKHEKWIFDFLEEDEFYQFLLKDNFKDISFTLNDLETKFHDFFYHGSDMDFDNEKWKKIIFKFMERTPPLIKQFFDRESATIKLKLTDEAYKA